MRKNKEINKTMILIVLLMKNNLVNYHSLIYILLF